MFFLDFIFSLESLFFESLKTGVKIKFGNKNFIMIKDEEESPCLR